ncbi:MAG: hypothetical protein RIQ76_1068 [Pseudomonadota bacterium]
MTAPVISEETEKGWYVSFNMPKQFTKETLPIPNNPEVKIIEVPSEKYAVITFSGLVREKKYAEILISVIEKYELWRYDLQIFSR